MAKLRPDVVHVTTNFEWVFRGLAFSFEMPCGFSFSTVDIARKWVSPSVRGTDVAVGFSFEVVEGLPDNAVGGPMVGYVATDERQTGDEK
ncbi:hypothetical protein CIW52_16625 [Mycolicibacterium sp. P9-64]|uniref:hypothetical protein n=1 Tax=Mycolicibacterium sp. P9-64 TaxID=2024612 RepID=UPI0011ED44C7|nr:hypothetical protein [Mycolicibacterium sp. P9-64]KAA0082590.1 hypothetical protein CIW52_16625 [Mycolicibacterium sp. P9-64]